MNWKALIRQLRKYGVIDNESFGRITVRIALLIVITLLLLGNNVYDYVIVIPLLLGMMLTFEDESGGFFFFFCASGVYVAYYLFIVLSMMTTGIYSTEVTIHLENQKVTQVNNKMYDEDGTWYLIESDNYPNLYIKGHEELNVEGVYSRFDTISKAKGDYININDKINTINRKVDK